MPGEINAILISYILIDSGFPITIGREVLWEEVRDNKSIVKEEP